MIKFFVLVDFAELKAETVETRENKPKLYIVDLSVDCPLIRSKRAVDKDSFVLTHPPLVSIFDFLRKASVGQGYFSRRNLIYLFTDVFPEFKVKFEKTECLIHNQIDCREWQVVL